MTRMIKANRKFKVWLVLTASTGDEVEVYAKNVDEAEEMVQKLIDEGAWNNYMNKHKLDVEIYIDWIEDIGSAIGD